MSSGFMLNRINAEGAGQWSGAIGAYDPELATWGTIGYLGNKNLINYNENYGHIGQALNGDTSFLNGMKYDYPPAITYDENTNGPSASTGTNNTNGSNSTNNTTNNTTATTNTTKDTVTINGREIKISKLEAVDDALDPSNIAARRKFEKTAKLVAEVTYDSKNTGNGTLKTVGGGIAAGAAVGAAVGIIVPGIGNVVGAVVGGIVGGIAGIFGGKAVDNAMNNATDKKAAELQDAFKNMTNAEFLAFQDYFEQNSGAPLNELLLSSENKKEGITSSFMDVYQERAAKAEKWYRSQED